MPNYKELREGYDLTVNVDNVTATRVFIDETGGLETLPAIGDSLSVTYPNTLCVSIKETMYHFEATVCKRKYVCTYSSSDFSTEVHPIPPSEPENLIVSGGTEIVAADANNSWYWHVDETVTGNATVQQKIYLNSVRGSISKTLIMSEAEYTAFKSAKIIPKLGHINDAALTPLTGTTGWFYPFKKGNVLFSSTSERLALDSDGDTVWEVTLNFAYRILYTGITTGAGNEAEYSWNYLINNRKGSGENFWQMPADTPGVPDVATSLLYKPTSFAGIFTF